MENKREEEIRKQLQHLGGTELMVCGYRATGRTTRIIDEVVQAFFNMPVGSHIAVVDHYGTMQADKYLLDKIRQRLDCEHPSVKYKTGRENGQFYIERTEKSYCELVKEEIERRTNEGGR